MKLTSVWADDLTGAAESAHAWQSATGGTVRLRLDQPEVAPGSGSPTVWDLDLRHRTDAEARARLSRLARHTTADASAFLKLDSQLRGPIAACLETLLIAGRSVLLSPANPPLGRTTTNGRHRIPTPDGAVIEVALSTLFSQLPHQHVQAADYAQLPQLLGEGEPVLVTADVTTRADLARLAGACAPVANLHFAGSAPFLGELVGLGAPRTVSSSPAETSAMPVRQALAVIGTTEPGSYAQIEALRARDPETAIVIAPETAKDARAITLAAGQVREALARGVHAVLRLPAHPDSSAAHRDAAAMGALAATCGAALQAVGSHVTLYLTGGHTARLILERLGLSQLIVVPGGDPVVARLLTPGGRIILTKPGSYGDRDTMLKLFKPARHRHTPNPVEEPSDGYH